MDNLHETVISNGYCVGCGACAYCENKSYTMNFGKDGVYTPIASNALEEDTAKVCPFSNSCKNEDQLGDELYKQVSGIKHNQYIGYYLNTYAGYAKEGDYRAKGSSGGMGTWIASKLLSTGLVDKVIHVKPSNKKGEALFTYQISSSIDELRQGAKSRYYPIEISNVMEYVKNNPGAYAFVGIPCFVKAVRLLSSYDSVIKERIKYTIGLVCGHLKSDRFAKSMAWQMGIQPDNLSNFDFRVKIEGRSAGSYGVKAASKIGEKETVKEDLTSNLFVTNWGHGFFKLQACDFCDDVVAETADITIGDAWVPEYVSDYLGTNIIIVRNPEIQNIIDKYKDELYLDAIDTQKVYQSQAGGFRHRRQGMQYRLYLKDNQAKWRPKKRFEASDKISGKRKRIYKGRIKLYEQSRLAYDKAQSAQDFNVFIQHMNPLIQKYNRISKRSIVSRAVGKIKRMLTK